MAHIKADPSTSPDAAEWSGSTARGRSAREMLEVQDTGVRYRAARRRRSWYSRKRVVFPLLFLMSMVGTVGLCWWFVPIDNPVTGARERQGDQLKRMVNNLFSPEQSLKASFMDQTQVRVLLLGLDHVPSRKGENPPHRADSIMVAASDFDTKQIRLLSIPRDSWVMHYAGDEEMGEDKLAHTYSYGQESDPDDPAAGVSRTRSTVEHLLSTQIDYYAVVKFDGFIKVIDALGGLDIDVEKRMKYRDRAGDLNIDLQPGLQHLNGTEVMGYARFRHDAMSDIARMGRQQTVLKQIFAEMQKPQNLPRMGSVLQVLPEAIQTNMTLDQLQALFMNIDDFKDGQLESQTLQSYGRNDHGMYPLSGRARSEWAQYLPPEEVERSRQFLSDLLPPPVEIDGVEGEATLEASSSAASGWSAGGD